MSSRFAHFQRFVGCLSCGSTVVVLRICRSGLVRFGSFWLYLVGFRCGRSGLCKSGFGLELGEGESALAPVLTPVSGDPIAVVPLETLGADSKNVYVYGYVVFH